MVSDAESVEESQFITQSGDEENLWEIVGILAEKRNMYKVKWTGNDPKTNKPWGNSWVKKKDVTPDVVQEWKEKQAEKLHRKSTKASKKSSGSTVSNRTSSTLRRGRSSVATTVKAASDPSPPQSPRPSRLPAPPPPPPPPPPILHPPSVSSPKVNGKRKISEVNAGSSDDDFEFPDTFTVVMSSTTQPQRKKRKVEEEAETPTPPTRISDPKSAVGLPKEQNEKISHVKRPPPKPAVVQTHRKEEEEEQQQEQEQEQEEDEENHDLIPPPPRKRPSILKNKSSSNDAISRESKAKGKGRAIDSFMPKQKSNRQSGQPRKSKGIVVVTDDDDGEESSVTEREQSRRSSEKVKSKHPANIQAEDDRRLSHSNKPAMRSTESTTTKADPQANSLLLKLQAAKPDKHKAPDKQRGKKEATMVKSRLKSKAPASEAPLAPRAKPPRPQKSLDRFESVASATDRDRPAEQGSDTEPSHPVAPYGESDVDSAAVDLMYPEEVGITSPGEKSKKKNGIYRSHPLHDLTTKIAAPQEPSVSPRRAHTSIPIPNTPSRSSLISKMKPRTPRPALLDDEFELFAGPTAEKQIKKVNVLTKQKALIPLPQLSPSSFYPHLHSSRIQSGFEEDEDMPMSSIDQFESPQKPVKRRAIVQVQTAKSKGKQRAVLDEETDDDGLDERIQALAKKPYAEKVKEREARVKEQEARESKGPRRPLHEVMMMHRSSSRAAPSSPSAFPQPPKPSEVEGDKEPSANLGQIPSPPYDDGFDDFYVDDHTMTQNTQMDTDDGQRVEPPLFLPMEEEETTQDLLHEMEVQRAISEAPSRSPSPVYEPEGLPQNDAPDDMDVIVDASIEPQPGTLPETLAEDSLEETGKATTSKAVPPLPSRGSSAAGIKAKYPPQGTQEVPATASVQEESQGSNQTNGSNDSTAQNAHVGYMTLLNTKSEEIVDLQRQRGEEQAKNGELVLRITVLEEELQNTRESERAEKQRADLHAQKWQVSQSQLLEANLKLRDADQIWAARVDALELELAKEKSKNAVTEGHFQDIKALYGQETGRCSVLKGEKKGLERELEIARAQAGEGVKAIRVMFEKRLQAMEDAKNTWKKMANFAVEKDARVNDDIRRRAAEEPELRAKCQQYKLKYVNSRNKADELEERFHGLGVMLEGERAEVGRLRQILEGLGLESESPTPASLPNGHTTAVLQFHSGESSTSSEELQMEIHGQPHKDENEDGDDVEEESSEDLVYRCHWRLEDDKYCNAMFPTTSGLEEHLFSSGHIPRTTAPIEELD